MVWQADQESFERGLLIGALAAEVAMKRGGSVGLRQFIVENEAKISARWDDRGGPRKMVEGDIYVLIPMMTAADLGEDFAKAIEARRAEMRSSSVEDESAVPQGFAQTQSPKEDQP